MGRLIGYMANRSDRLAEALTEERPAIGPAPVGDADAWGIGFYQGGEVLHKKGPRLAAGGPALEWQELAGNVRSDCAVIHFRHATVGDYRSENTHPFRMRQWLFAHDGTVHGFEAIREGLLEPMPDFLRRNIRGTTDSEHVFHALLSFLHDRGQLDNPDIDPKTVLGAIRSTVALIDRLVSEVGAPAASLNMVLTNGRQMYGLRRGSAMSRVAREVPEDRRPPAKSFRYVLLVSNGPTLPPDYEPLREAEVAIVTHDISVSTVLL